MLKISTVLLAFFTVAKVASALDHSDLPHIPLDSSGTVYLHMGRTVHVPMRASDFADGLESVIAMGVRNLEWLDHINQKTKKNISISKPENMKAYPVDSPRIYNREIVLREFNEVKSNMPEAMREVLFGTEKYPDELPLPQEEYEKWALQADRSYQAAARWRLLSAYIPALTARRAKDVRGYYFLKDVEDLDTKLSKFSSFKAKEKATYKLALVRLCINSNLSIAACEAELDRAIEQNRVVEYKNKYWNRAEKNWASYFEIPYFGRFPDVRWSKSKNEEARVPFRKPKTSELEYFLKHNLEEEWQWDSWQLVVDFDLPSSHAIDVRFEPGITPHVPGLGSNIIYMDANAPLSEWDVQWTIRHEFGHNLGFPDCYHEFYDTEKAVIIGYQIDIEDLMCSRRGKLKQRHFDQMKDAYLN